VNGDNGRGDAITEPAGRGDFAEAMRELIAQLTPVPETLREAQPQKAPAVRAARPNHLRLVR
jgi:hypothetical protein